MAQIKYKDTQRLRQWDLLALIGGLIILGVVSLIQVVIAGSPNRNVILILALGILILSGLFYYLNTIKLIAKYNEKTIKLRMLPIGSVKRKIKWEDVAESEIVDLPRASRLDEWNAQISSLSNVITRHGNTCLHLKMKNDEVINIGCSDRKQMEEFVQNVKEYHSDLEK